MRPLCARTLFQFRRANCSPSTAAPFWITLTEALLGGNKVRGGSVGARLEQEVWVSQLGEKPCNSMHQIDWVSHRKYLFLLNSIAMSSFIQTRLNHLT